MKKMFVTTIAFSLYHLTPAFAAPAPTPAAPPAPSGFTVPSECKNLALMQGQLLNTRFHNNNMGDGTVNPSTLLLKTNNGLQIGTIEYLGGDSEDQAFAGKYPCDLEPKLCSNLADAGGVFDWARLTVTQTEQGNTYPVGTVVVSMGSRGGCIINSAAQTPQL